MKAEELRIGNILSHTKHGVCIVHGVKGGQAHPGAYTTNGLIRLNEIEPIILTEEWILKLGFDKFGRDDMPRTITFENNWISIFPANKFCDFEGYGFMWYKPDQNKTIESARVILKYVHQLQNLYYSLTGKELTIKE